MRSYTLKPWFLHGNHKIFGRVSNKATTKNNNGLRCLSGAHGSTHQIWHSSIPEGKSVNVINNQRNRSTPQSVTTDLLGTRPIMTPFRIEPDLSFISSIQ
jgi:hypothetical protein